jgi:hypothetical protein
MNVSALGLDAAVVLLVSVKDLAIVSAPRPGNSKSAPEGASTMAREFIALNGRIWLIRPRPEVRKDEVASHVTLELVSDSETRVVSCRREEWEVGDPDLAALLARSVVSGASRSIVSIRDP